MLLAADWFRNGFTFSSELGWKHSGHDRVTLAVAIGEQNFGVPLRVIGIVESGSTQLHRNVVGLSTA